MTDKPTVRLTPRSSPDPERNLNQACARVFETPDGALILEWLMFAYINTIMSDEAPDAALRYREGARSVVAAMMTRATEGRKQPREPDPPIQRNAARSRRTRPPVSV